MKPNKDVTKTHFEYLGRMVEKKYFKAFVYNGKEEKLAENYEQFLQLIGSGLWFETKELAKELLNKESLNKREKIKDKLKLASSSEG